MTEDVEGAGLVVEERVVDWADIFDEVDAAEAVLEVDKADVVDNVDAAEAVLPVDKADVMLDVEATAPATLNLGVKLY